MSKMFLILQCLAFSWQLFGPVTLLAKLRENYETKQKIEFQVKYLTVFRS